jgi:hypothetical protein
VSALLIAGAMIVSLSCSIADPLEKTSGVADLIAEGDLARTCGPETPGRGRHWRKHSSHVALAERRGPRVRSPTAT